MYLIFKIQFDCFIAKKRNIGSGVIVLRISNVHYIYKLCCKKLPFWSGDSGGEGFLKGFFRTHILIVQFVFFISKLKNDSLFTFDTVVLELTSKMFLKKCTGRLTNGQSNRQWRLEKHI